MGLDRKPLSVAYVQEEWYFTEEDVVTIMNSPWHIPSLNMTLQPHYIVRLPTPAMYGGCECTEFLVEQANIYYVNGTDKRIQI